MVTVPFLIVGMMMMMCYWRMGANSLSDEEKLQKSMEQYFQCLAVDKPIELLEQYNHGVQVVMLGKSACEDDVDPEELAWCRDKFGDACLGGYATPVPSDLRLRTERQTLRHLPHSGAIVFTIWTYSTPVEGEDGVPGRLASSLRRYRSKMVGDVIQARATKPNKNDMLRQPSSSFFFTPQRRHGLKICFSSTFSSSNSSDPFRF